MSLLKTGTNFGEFWRIKKIANLSARKKKQKKCKTLGACILHTALYCANARARKLATPRV